MADNLALEAILVLETSGLVFEPGGALRFGDGSWTEGELLA